MLQLGIQLFSVRNHLSHDWRRTLEEISKVGYRYIEPANHNVTSDDGIGFGVSAKEMRKVLEDCNLKVCNTHLNPIYNNSALERLPGILEYQKEIGCNRVCCAISFFKSMDEIKRLCELFNKFGEICKKYNMDFMYHNHYFEFQTFPDQNQMVMDYLLKYTNSNLVKFELDTYWAIRGGQNVVELIKRLGDRLLMVHLKDFTKDCGIPLNLIESVNKRGIPVDLEYYNSTKTPGAFTEIGTGILDIQSYINATLEFTSADYLILEQDFSKYDEIDSIKRSYKEFGKYTGVHL